MRRKLSWLILFSAAIAVLALYVRKSTATPATPPPGFVSTTLAQGRFGEIDVFNHFIPPTSAPERHRHNIWLSWQKTKGSSDVYVQTNTWQPGGSTGWHTHPGHSLITVTAGTLTAYEGDDPDCKPHVYTAGMGFVDPGGGHVHIIRNEGTIDASTVAVQVIPAGQPRRIDAPDPGNCHF
jgi:uncharacterized RmlC-like cupin family protein